MPDLEPGPELNTLMATLVMGWHQEEGCACWLDGEEVLNWKCWDEQDGYFSPSTDIAAAFEVLHKLMDSIGSIRFGLTRHDGGKYGPSWDASFLPHDEAGAFPSVAEWIGVFHADTAPLVICLCALKAVGHDHG